jgi:hypothetical protein
MTDKTQEPAMAEAKKKWDGMPPNPEKSAWHWLRWTNWGTHDPAPYQWDADDESWDTDNGDGCPESIAQDFEYCGVCVPPSEAEPAPEAADAARFRSALSTLIDDIDQVHGFIDLEAGCGGEGSVVTACRVIDKPIPPHLAAWLKESEEEDGADMAQEGGDVG